MEITKLSLLEARELYKTCTKAMKCETTGAVTFEVTNFGHTVIVKAIPATNTYTMTDRSEWRDDLFTNPETTYKQTILRG